MQKEITVFTEGDASLASTWSNVPYYLTRTLEAKGYTVNRVNVDDSGILQKFYDKFLCRILRHTLLPHTTFRYQRSYLYELKWKYLIRKALHTYPNSDCYISTTFSFSPSSYTDKPCVLFCDWTYEYLIRHFQQRKPDFLEMPVIKRQDQLIETADYIFTLFPDVAQDMHTYYHNPHIAYLGNVINSDSFPAFENERTSADFFLQKLHNQKILFIGLPKYKEGALTLIHSMQVLRLSYPQLTLDIIGMDAADCDLTHCPSFIHFHGYLSKDIPCEKELYYSLLHHATVYVNTTPLWAGFSSALESLYHYLPVITSPYTSFLDTFGKEIDFGYYCKENTTALICATLEQVLSLSESDYRILCENAHNSTSAYTWSAYIDKMLTKIGL